jgi:Flp pilus assembly protein TadG
MMKQGIKQLVADQSGVIAVWAAIAFVGLAGFAALVVDIGRLAIVRGELQKAADAGALAGARGLTGATPNWTNAQGLATATAKENKANGSLITNCDVQVGYWDLSWTQATAPASLKSSGIVPTSQDVPAVKVTISEAPGQNSGSLAMLFGSVLGVNSTTVQAQTTACSIPMPVNKIDAGQAFPMATPVSFVNQLRGTSPPPSFRIGSAYHDPTGGQWTSFLTDANNVPAIRQLIDSGNPGPLKVGDQIWVQPGTESTLYNEAETLKGRTMLLPVVANDFNTHDDTPILAFVPFYIEDAAGGNAKYIQGHFVNSYNVPGGIGAAGTPNYGAMAGAPKLMN